MNSFTLKIIAMITMLIDHVAYVLIPSDTTLYLVCRGIGRLAFPIFCFLLVEGFFHTKNVKKYMIRLAAFAIISEGPFDLAFGEHTTNIDFLLHQNVFFTLFIGLGVIYFMNKVEQKYAGKLLLVNIFELLVVVVGSGVATILFTDYSYMGIMMIAAFYLFRRNKVLMTTSLFIVNGFTNSIQGLATASMVLIWFYNGKKGPGINKYIFYGFYPVHILCIYLISLLPMFQ